MSNITFKRERMATVLDEIMVLNELHYHELWDDEDEIFHLNPDYKKYADLEKIKRLHIMTARDGSVLVGYVVSVLDYNPHFKHILTAQNDLIYLDKEYRGGKVSNDLLDATEKDLESLGVDMMVMHITSKINFDKLLTNRDYDKFEIVYKKLLGER